MTDSIDLDEIETEEEEPKGPEPNRGDWFWRGEGDPEEEEAESASSSSSSPGSDTNGDADIEANAAIPHIPRQNRDKPVGMPTSQGGAGGTSARAAAEAGDEGGSEPAPEEASGPHGGGADDLTMAFTYSAAKRLEDPGFVFAGATWADWIGIVGEVDAHVINKFQRENGIDADFFNGSGTGPAERLAEVTEMSMFFADRMIVVGCEGEEWIAEESGWEFVPFDEAAEAAEWDVSE